jgi:GNAT superfamily N-acetyltransferase
MRLIELDTVTDEDWRQVIAGEPEPWGGVGETLRWREQTHQLGVLDGVGHLLALAGLVLADVEAGGTRLEVAGVGGVFVTRAARGRGLARLMIERLLELAVELGAERAMLFCRPANVGLYAKFGFELITAPVSARQPGGSVRMPMRAMWKPLSDGVRWPKGEVEVLGEPF